MPECVARGSPTRGWSANRAAIRSKSACQRAWASDTAARLSESSMRRIIRHRGGRCAVAREASGALDRLAHRARQALLDPRTGPPPQPDDQRAEVAGLEHERDDARELPLAFLEPGQADGPAQDESHEHPGGD